jgi:glycosyltransferase involved in cell wall biosynthesis
VSTPKVLHLSTYNAHGGAARAAIAIHSSLQAAGVDSLMRIAQADNLKFKLAKEADRRIWGLQKSDTLTWRSPARFGSMTAKEINSTSADIVHLHWVTDGFLTIETIGKINKPIVWSLCDAWAFSGAEHYATQVSRTRSQQGYQKSNRHPNDSGFDVDRWTWNRKKGNWHQPMQLLPASGWLTQATRESALMGTWPITQIPHIVDTSVFTPQPQKDKKMPVLLFLASAGIHDRRKGWDLLEQSLDDPALATKVHVVVVNPVTSGYLAEPENPHDLAQGIEQVLQRNLRESTRTHALTTWSPEVVVPQLLEVYTRALV